SSSWSRECTSPATSPIWRIRSWPWSPKGGGKHSWPNPTTRIRAGGALRFDFAAKTRRSFLPCNGREHRGPDQRYQSSFFPPSTLRRPAAVQLQGERFRVHKAIPPLGSEQYLAPSTCKLWLTPP